jgi:hypothetical protein
MSSMTDTTTGVIATSNNSSNVGTTKIDPFSNSSKSAPATLFLSDSDSSKRADPNSNDDDTHGKDWKTFGNEVASSTARATQKSKYIHQLLSQVYTKSFAKIMVQNLLPTASSNLLPTASSNLLPTTSSTNPLESFEGDWENNAAEYSSGSDNDSDESSFAMDGQYHLEETQEVEPRTFSGVSKYVDATNWNGSNIIVLPNGNKYVGDSNPSNGQPHGKGKMKRVVLKETQRIRNINDVLVPPAIKVNVSAKKSEESEESEESEQSMLDESLSLSLSARTKTTAISEFFDGTWENGVFVEGLWRIQTGDSYKGTFKESKFHGKGHYCWADGEEYKGDWVNGKRQGIGRYVHVDGSVYNGPFIDNKEDTTGGFIGVKKWGLKPRRKRKKKTDQLETETKENNTQVQQTYTGEWKEGAIHGNGKMLFANGAWFEGKFEHDKRCGQGTLHWNDGYCYQGLWKNDVMDGDGVITNQIHRSTQGTGFGDGGVVYKGSFLNGKKDGDGMEHFNDQSTYKGKYKNGLPEGFGVWLGNETRPYASIVRRESYEGEWKEGKKDGKGHYITFSGVYVGSFKQNLPHGENYYTNSSTKESYNGNWKCGLKEGEGVWECNGIRYEGSWYEDMYHGPGRLTDVDGNTLIGGFFRGELEGEGEMKSLNGHGSYKGNFKRGQYHGHGVLIGVGSPLDKYMGDWHEGQRHGQGEQGYENGSRYVGEWAHGTYKGKGEWWGADGHFLNFYKGTFINGLPDGFGTMRWNSNVGSNIAQPMVYEGNFKKGVCQGEGILIWPNRCRFEGLFGVERSRAKKGTSKQEGPEEGSNGAELFHVHIQHAQRGCYLGLDGRLLYGHFTGTVIREGTPFTHECKKNKPTLIPRRPKKNKQKVNDGSPRSAKKVVAEVASPVASADY